ncbi:MAG: peptidylprolyl isomerase [Cyclobacteriaceae bacterium]|nr:peptidylprolyl isomerase [Cyclobacteriaceae bacterium]
MIKTFLSLLIITFLAGGPKGKDEVVTVHTQLGNISIILFDETPNHKANFLKLAKDGFYDGTTFHRVMDDFMIQGGDPNSKDDNPSNDGMGGPGYTIPAEFVNGLIHVKGAVAAARQNDRVNPEKASSGSQFYIVENEEGAHFLDNKYTVFGQVIKGMDVVEKIAKVEKDGRNRPLKDIKMTMTVKRMLKKKVQKEYEYTY